MEPKQVCSEQSPFASARYQSFIARNLESINQCRIKELLLGRRIRACFHGWVILSNHPDSVLWSLWNPLTSKLIRLPPLIHKEKDPHDCCLSSPPDNQGSVFLLTTGKLPTIVFCLLDSKRKRLKWTKMSYAKQLRAISGFDGGFLQCPTCCNGKVYAMTFRPYYNYMIVIHVDIVVKGKEVVIRLQPFVKAPYLFYGRGPSCHSSQNVPSFLKGSCKELFYITVWCKDQRRKSISDLYLYRLDMTRMIWVEVVDLKDAIFFLEFSRDNMCLVFYKSPVRSEVGGYVHILGEKDDIMHSFHVKDRTMSLSSTPCIVRENQGLAWAMLECRLEVDHHVSILEEVDKENKISVRPIKGDGTKFNSIRSESHSHLLNVPFHILETIMEHCIGVEYLNFRATCKRCSLAAPPIQWRNKTMLRRLQMYSLDSPWLMVLDNYRGVITFIDPVCGDRYFIKRPSKLKNYHRICCSNHGWLLMYNLNRSLVFFNPFTAKIRKLPRVPYLESFCFSAPPTSPDCMVVGFTRHGPWHVYIHHVSQDSSWHRHRLHFGRSYPYSFHYPTFSGLDIYALCDSKRIEAFFDIDDETYSWELVEDNAPRSYCKYPATPYLSKCDQQLSLIIVGEFGESVEIFKLNESKEQWERVDNLGKHMIYISDTSCFCLEAKLPGMENKIYFPRLLDKDNGNVVFYSLETRRYHTFDGKVMEGSFAGRLFGTKHLCLPHTWIEPSWS